jgi:hypothetical protein
MTYCAGWRYRESVYLLSDTAVTKSLPPQTVISSFGQLHDKVRGMYVEEALLKILPIAPDTVVALAGDVQIATTIIEFLKENLHKAVTIESLFASVTTSMGPFDPRRCVELLLAYSPTSGKPKLIRWDSTHGIDVTESDFYQIGSLTSYHAALTPQVLAVLVQRKLAPDRILPVLSAIVQSYGIHDNLINLNIGGVIFGLRLYNEKIDWQEDTNFILYDPTFKNISYISAFSRNNVLVVSSSLTNDIRVFAHTVSTSSTQTWLDYWGPFIRKHLNSNKYRYWVFISTTSRIITVLRRDNLDSENKYFTLQYSGDGNFSLGLSPEMMSLLSQPLIDHGDGSLPFRLNFRNA